MMLMHHIAIHLWRMLRRIRLSVSRRTLLSAMFVWFSYALLDLLFPFVTFAAIFGCIIGCFGGLVFGRDRRTFSDRCCLQ